MQENDEDHAKEAVNKILTNVQRTYYEVSINDIIKRIASLESRNDNIGSEISRINVLLDSNETETSEYLTNLEKSIATETARVDRLKSQIEELENRRLEDQKSNEIRVADLEKKYESKRLELRSSLKYLAAKINAVDDFKRIHASLREKYENQNERLIKLESQVKDALERCTQKFELDRDALKKKAYRQLLSLSTSFQSKVAESINRTAKRLMQENLSLKTTLKQILSYVDGQGKTYKNVLSDGPELTKDLKEQTAELKKNLIVQAIQDRVANSVIAVHKQIAMQTVDLDTTHSAADTLLQLDNRKLLESEYSHKLPEILVEIDKERQRLEIAREHEKEHENRLTDIFGDIYAMKIALGEILFPYCENNCDWTARSIVSVENILSSTLSYLQ